MSIDLAITLWFLAYDGEDRAWRCDRAKYRFGK